MGNENLYKKILSSFWWYLTKKMWNAGFGEKWMLRQVEKACYYKNRMS